MERIESGVSRREAPQLSIVVASPYSVRDLESCLNNLARQVSGSEVEVIVADCSQDGAPERITESYPDVTVIRRPEKSALPVLWGDGIAASTGQVIAVTDSTCRVGPDWVEAIIEAHQAPHPVIGGAVEAVELSRLVDWAAYFCDYGHFMPPLKKGPVKELPGNNISFKRAALETGREYVRDGFWKTYWLRELQAQGVELRSEPSIVIYYRKSVGLLPLLTHRFHRAKCFAGMRATQVTALTRASYAAGSFLLPFLLLFRIARTILPKGRRLKEFLLSLPFSTLAIISWSAGELCGYIRGPGNSCDHIY